MRRAGHTLVSALLLAVPLPALAAELRGTVRDAERPLAGVRVEVGDGLVLVTTGDDGRFRLDVAEGRHQLRIAQHGYALVEDAVEVPAAGLDVEVALRPSALDLHENVVVSARREADAGFDSLRAATVLTGDDIQRQAARTTPEALAEVTGAWVQKTNHGGGSPFLRGLTGNHVLVLVDGIRLNNGTFRYGPNQYLTTIDPLSLEHVEVVRGIGSVLHGSDALGGVVSVTTAQPEFSSDGLVVSGRLHGKLASHDQEATSRAEVQVSGRNAAVRGGFSLRDHGDLRAGRGLGVEAPSGYGERDGDVKGALRVGRNNLLTAAYQHVHQSDVPRWDQVARRGFARYSFDPQVRQLGYGQWQSFLGRPWAESVKAAVSFHRSDETRIRQQATSPVTVTERDVVDTWGWSLQARSTTRSWTFVWGAEGYHDHVSSSRRDRNAATGATRDARGLYPDGATARSTAAFLDARRQHGRWTVEGGARYTRHRVVAEDAGFGRIDVEPSAVVGSAGASFEWAAGHRVVASVQQGFRAPNVDDLSTLGLFDFGIEVPSPSLAPERAWSYEVGYKARTSRLAVGASLFRTELRDLVDRVPDSYQGADHLEGQRVYRRANVGRAHVQGAEAELQWSATGRVVALGYLAYTFGHMDSSDEPLRRIPPLNGGVALRWSSARRLAVEGIVRFAARQDRLAAGDRADPRISPDGTPGWRVVSARGTYELHRSVLLHGGIDNLFDEAYRVHGSGIDGQGRTAWLSAQVRF